MNTEALINALHFAIAEHEFSQNGTTALWNQGTWGEVRSLDAVDLAHIVKSREQAMAYVPVSCPSGMCLAGNIVTEAGHKFLIPLDIDIDEVDDTDEATLREAVKSEQDEGGVIDVDLCVSRDGEVSDISEKARDILDLSDTYTYSLMGLFDADNDIYNACFIGMALAKRHGQDISDPLIARYAEGDYRVRGEGPEALDNALTNYVGEWR